MWLSDLDSTAHAKGVGAPETVEVLRHVDGEIKRIEDGLKAAGLFDGYDIWVTSDHGFSTHTGAVDLDAVLKPFARTLADGSPRIVTSGGAIYVRDGDAGGRRRRSSRRCRRRPEWERSSRGRRSRDRSTGACRARCRSTRRGGITSGPRRFCSRRTGRDAANAHGMRGNGRVRRDRGARQLEPVGHPQHADCRRARPEAGRHDRCAERERRLRADLPAGCSACRFRRPCRDGRSRKALVDGAAPGANAVRTIEHTASTPDGTYAVTGTFSIVSAGGREYRYFDGTRVTRK